MSKVNTKGFYQRYYYWNKNEGNSHRIDEHTESQKHQVDEQEHDILVVRNPEQEAGYRIWNFLDRDDVREGIGTSYEQG